MGLRKRRNGSTTSLGSKDSSSKHFWTVMPAMLRLNSMSEPGGLGVRKGSKESSSRKGSKEAARQGSKDRSPANARNGSMEPAKPTSESGKKKREGTGKEPACCVIS